MKHLTAFLLCYCSVWEVTSDKAEGDMNKLIICVVVIALAIFPTTVSAWTVDCDGYDSDTGEYVYGECSNGEG